MYLTRSSCVCVCACDHVSTLILCSKLCIYGRGSHLDSHDIVRL